MHRLSNHNSIPQRKTIARPKLKIFQSIKQTAVLAVIAKTLLSFNQLGFSQILNCSANCGRRHFCVGGYSVYRGPAYAILVGAILEIDIHDKGSVRQVHFINRFKSAYFCSPPFRWIRGCIGLVCGFCVFCCSITRLLPLPDFESSFLSDFLFVAGFSGSLFSAG